MTSAFSWVEDTWANKQLTHAHNKVGRTNLHKCTHCKIGVKSEDGLEIKRDTVRVDKTKPTETPPLRTMEQVNQVLY